MLVHPAEPVLQFVQLVVLPSSIKCFYQNRVLQLKLNRPRVVVHQNDPVEALAQLAQIFDEDRHPSLNDLRAVLLVNSVLDDPLLVKPVD